MCWTKSGTSRLTRTQPERREKHRHAADLLGERAHHERLNNFQALAVTATSLTCGVRKGESDGFAAHAWLTAGSVPVTGGDGSDYSEVAPG